MKRFWPERKPRQQPLVNCCSVSVSISCCSLPVFAALVAGVVLLILAARTGQGPHAEEAGQPSPA